MALPDSTKTKGAPSFAVFAKGGSKEYRDGRIGRWGGKNQVASTVLAPALAKTEGRGIRRSNLEFMPCDGLTEQILVLA